ncbi:MAG: hypothetical protein ACPGEF_03585 [Endozoicomonas sp.]
MSWLHKKQTGHLSIAFQVATSLSALTHPDHLIFSGFLATGIILGQAPGSNLKSDGYKRNDSDSFAILSNYELINIITL